MSEPATGQVATSHGSVSVALCTFNGARYIAAQLESIFAQGDVVSELVVADDGSTDDTLDRVREAVERAGWSDRVRVLTGGGHGVTANFERAVRACRGEFIALSDQDDEWLPGRLTAQLDRLAASAGAELLFADAELVDAGGSPLGATLFQHLEVGAPELYEIAGAGAFGALLRRNIVTGATVVFRRSLLERALPFPSEWVHDEWLAIVAAATGSVVPLDRPVTAYRQHGANQIGVAAPTLCRKVRRVLQPRGARNRDLATRSAVLADRLEQLGVSASRLDAARAKSAFERFRADLPTARPPRIVPVLARAASGDYARYASQGTMDIVRDLVQPAD
ncbi:glycosyltransferase family 2 protein [Agromyces aerolatus]|uniref:glycosyltransferase family 2 protein n=1 Tax=Agromyces sp. LY-1074 TaxID=3074080 RepID=UPI00285F451F|nr:MULTISPECIES: glycosyltransferase family 2 protein [unclassified Agromyces]MDR5700380.1 glycosyltransferase family 2 protein [Agromyces sp. LY-1074]MDR5706642.1 glycosyltransferase family 2 protein [Agromyces sp. LY-1358]